MSGSSSLLVSSHEIEVRRQTTSDICIVQEAHMRHCNLQRKIRKRSVLLLGRKESTLKRFLYPSFRVAWGSSRHVYECHVLKISFRSHRLPASGSSSYDRRSSFSFGPPQASLGWCLTFESLSYRHLNLQHLHCTIQHNP